MKCLYFMTFNKQAGQFIRETYELMKTLNFIWKA